MEETKHVVIPLISLPTSYNALIRGQRNDSFISCDMKEWTIEDLIIWHDSHSQHYLKREWLKLFCRTEIVQPRTVKLDWVRPQCSFHFLHAGKLVGRPFDDSSFTRIWKAGQVWVQLKRFGMPCFLQVQSFTKSQQYHRSTDSKQEMDLVTYS